VFVAAAGGLVVREPAADLALCLAVQSAFGSVSIPEDVVAIGEVGLGGEIRRVPGLKRRLAEAARLGFRRALVPSGSRATVSGLQIVEVDDVRSALSLARAAEQRTLTAL
jgi:DNA repair protein RadA/Sms